MSSSAAFNVQEKRGGNDPAWDQGKKVPDKSNKMECNFCKNEYEGVIPRLKEDIEHINRNVKRCSLAPDNVKQKALVILNKSRVGKERKNNGTLDLIK